MFKDNLSALRRMKKRSQESLALELGVSRQTLSKWETGEALPDIERCRQLAEVLDVALDDLVCDRPAQGLPIPPKGKYAFGVVTVGDKGQIVIPAKARKVFGIQPGDQIVVLGEQGNGIALLKEKDLLAMIAHFQSGDDT